MTSIRITVLTVLSLLAVSSAAQQVALTSTTPVCCKSCSLPNVPRCKKPKPERKSVLLSCMERLSDFHEDSPLTKNCAAVAEAMAYNYIEEHPELLLPDALLKVEPPKSAPSKISPDAPAHKSSGIQDQIWADFYSSSLDLFQPQPCGYTNTAELGDDGQCHAEILLAPKEWDCAQPPNKPNVLLCVFKPEKQ